MKIRLTIFLYLFCAATIFSQSNEWIVSFDTSPSDVLLKEKNNNSFNSVKLLSDDLNIYLITYSEAVDRKFVLDQLHGKAQVRHVSPNTEVELRRTPNDDLYGDQYHLDLIQAEKVWEETTGKSNGNDNYVIAMLDDGFDYLHQDITPNLWKNEGEIPADGIDNDNNGLVDDYNGLNIETNNDDHAIEEHGSQVLGILGAKGDNSTGITGVMWDANVMIVSGISNVGEIIAGLNYSYKMKKLYDSSNGTLGANIVATNFSGGLKRFYPSDFPDWCEMYDLLGSVGILSIGSVANENFDVEAEGDMPTLCTSPYLITVSNTDMNDIKDVNSAYGSTSVDLAAPGERIISTDVGNGYAVISGTSACSPQVAAAVGLLYTVNCDAIREEHKVNPSQLALDIKEAIISGVDELPSLSESVSKGRLNIFKSMLGLVDLCGGTAIGALQVESIVPNPITNATMSSGSLQYTTDVFSEHQFIINDAMGRLIFSQKFFPSTFSTKRILLDQVPYLDNGAYSFSLMNENSISSTSVIVVN